MHQPLHWSRRDWPFRLLLAAIWLHAAPATAYNEAGHFYSIIAVDHGRKELLSGAQHDAAVVTALCAQIPDLSSELDAVTLRVKLLEDPGGWLWGPFSVCASDAVRQMDMVHHYVHALTDTPAAPVREAAVATLTRLWQEQMTQPSAVNACAVGIALHLVGDSYAHIRLESLPNAQRMYAPGMGHYKDNHDPDYVVFRPDREAAWEDYLVTVARATQVQIDDAYRTGIFQIIRGDLKGGTEDNFFHTYDILNQIDGVISSPQGASWQPWVPGAPRVEALYGNAGWWDSHVLSMSFDEVIKKYLPQDASTLHFSDVWPIYKKSARNEFTKRGIRARCDKE